MTVFTITVEIYDGSSWVDITRLDDDTHVLFPITITRGRNDEQVSISPTSIRFRMLDNPCRLDGENYASDFYHRIGLGTSLRVLLDGYPRAVGEISVLDVEPGETPEINYLNVEATGILYRLTESRTPLRSAAYRALSAPENDATRLVYVPLEEESSATTIATFNNVGQAVFEGEYSLGSDTDSASSERLAVFGAGGILTVSIPPHTATLEYKICSLWRIPSGGLTSGHVMLSAVCAGGNVENVWIRSTAPYTLSVEVTRGGAVLGAGTASFDATAYLQDEQEVFISFELTQDGSDVDCRILLVREDGTAITSDGTLVGVTMGRMTYAVVGVNDIDGASFGQLIVGNDTGAFPNYISPDVFSGALGTRGFAGEGSSIRAFRLASEAGETLLASFEGEPMGPQEVETFGDLLDSTSDVGQGILFEERTTGVLQSMALEDLYNQPPVASLTYAHLQPGLKPTTDNNRVTNDVTVSRPDGGSERYVIPDGDPYHWSTQDPPTGARQRPTSGEPQVFSDTQLLPQAAWRSHVGAWREKRFPVVVLELAKPVFTADDRAAARLLDVGTMLAIDTTGAPAFLPYYELRELVQGYTETLDRFTHNIALNTTPADVYEVGYVDFGVGAKLANVIDADDTSIKIQPGDGPAPSQSASDLPYHIAVNGQPMTVTAISTDTPLFIAAGAVSYADNAAITPALPAGITANLGQLMVAVIFRRQTGAGVIGATPTGWTEILRSPDNNWVIAGRYYVSGDAAVQWTVSGGSAGDTVGGFVLGFAGLSMTLDKNAPSGYPLGYARSLNSSAQNIAYPAYTARRTNTRILLFGIKDDDWTGVSDPDGWEIVDSSSTTGSDIGAVLWAISTAIAGLAWSAGTFTVTGGASAVSEAVAVGLRPLQTATVTRGIYGAAVAANPGAEIRGWRMGVNAL